MSNEKCWLKSVDELLGLKLCIPDYQRPYKWEIQNIEDLLNDISVSIDDANKYGSEYKYRIGTIILHKNGAEYDVVDGQQRIISLALLKKCLSSNYTCSIFKKPFEDKTTQNNIHNNYTYMKEWFSLNSEMKASFLTAFKDVLQVVVIPVNNTSEAFQLFDSQNTRGKELDPHDLLKAYHLREMKDYPYEMEHAVTKWEEKKTKDIRELFDLYLFPIWNWSRGNKTKSFTEKDISTFKGIPESSQYYYAKRASKAMPYFQITEPFIAGNDFFEMVDHYLLLLKDIKSEIGNNEKFVLINDIIKVKNESAGFKYAKNLFYCALMCYYDKYHNFDVLAVKKIFLWAFMLRVDMEHLGYESINNYAIGDSNDRYTNHIAMFSKINLARMHTEISSLQIVVRKNQKKGDNWLGLYNQLMKIVGIEEQNNE